MRISTLLFATLLLSSTLPSQDADPGRLVFEGRCARCHGGDGNGGDMGPAIRRRLPALSNEQLAKLIRTGTPGGMPPIQVADAEMEPLTRFLRTLQPRNFRREVVREKVQTTDGKTLEGEVRNQGFDDLQLLSDDHRVHLLRRAGDKFREVTSRTDWPGYNGDPGGNRYTTLEPDHQGERRRAWRPSGSSPCPTRRTLRSHTGRRATASCMSRAPMNATRSTPAPAARSGTIAPPLRQASSATPPSASIAAWRRGDRVFMVTDNAHLIWRSPASPASCCGKPRWPTGIRITTRPPRHSLVGNLVISGTAGGDEGVRGFVAAYDQATGKEVWRFWTVPKPGEPAFRNLEGQGIEHPGRATWLTGTYDPQLDTVYWPTGNPGPDYNGDDRLGDNLYSDCILALDAKTGKLKWYYQFTPHDLCDWDATEPPVVVDTTWQGKPRKLLIQANRNGFFYVFDRTNGKLLLAKPFVTNLNWASGIGADGRPIKLPNRAERRGDQGVPLAGRRHQLVLAFLQSRHRSVLRADFRKVQRLHQARSGSVDAGQGIPGRFAAPAGMVKSRSES